ncbi:hypothetical protein XENOCAPTIV_020838, partial [Xenoophorus captivus]
HFSIGPPQPEELLLPLNSVLPPNLLSASCLLRSCPGLITCLLFIFHCISPSFINTFIVIGLFEETSDTQLP